MKTINESSGYQVHPDDLDVRGWNLVVDDVKVGTVNDLVLNDDRSRVKYLDVLRKDRSNDTDYHYLIPMNEVVFDRHNKHVSLERYTSHFIDTYPRFSDKMPSDYEEKIRLYYSDTREDAYPDRNYRDHERGYEEDRVYEVRPHKDEIRVENSRRKESLFGRDYEKINPENWEERVKALENQKQIRKLEMERDLAIIDKEIMQIKQDHL
jgi:hypothetical protein